MKLKPSLVLQKYWTCSSREVKQLGSLGVPVLCVRVENIDDIYRFVLLLGKVLGEESYLVNCSIAVPFTPSKVLKNGAPLTYYKAPKFSGEATTMFPVDLSVYTNVEVNAYSTM